MENLVQSWKARLNASNLDESRKLEFKTVISQFLSDWDHLANSDQGPTRVQASQSLRQLREKRSSAEKIQSWRDAFDWYFDADQSAAKEEKSRLKAFAQGFQKRAMPLPNVAGPGSAPILNRVAYDRAANAQNLRERTRKSYWNWLRRYDQFCRKAQIDLDLASSVEAFLDHLRDEEKLAPMSRTQALNALKFLYRHVFSKPFEAKVKPARKSERTPVVLSRKELELLFEAMEPDLQLMCRVMYGAGLKLTELLELRVRDIDLEEKRLVVPDSRGEAKRTAPLPNAVQSELKTHLETVLQRYESDRHHGAPGAMVSEAILLRHPEADSAWDWQWVFPSRNWTRDSETNQRRRHHWNAFTFQRSVKRAGEKAGLTKKVTPHVFRHSFATHLLQSGTDPKAVQKLMGHRTLETTLSYLHAIRNEQEVIRSPLDY
tara:strand:- start:15054 stop:16349 length:1296 start_codon:yes stop_codon:yes gene_type:complete